jgi:hypothetical protein
MGSDFAVYCGEIVILVVYICIYITFLNLVFGIFSSLYQKDESYNRNIEAFIARQVACTLQQMELCANIEIHLSMNPLISNNALQRTRGTSQDKGISPSPTLFLHLLHLSS